MRDTQQQRELPAMTAATAATLSAATSTVMMSEVFGPTLQGEGPHTGQLAAFVRLGGCNLTCSWCDTPYTWDGHRFDLHTELSRWPIPDVVSAVREMGVERVVVTGGEPLLQQGPRHGLVPLVRRLDQFGIAVDVETNGTLKPRPDLVDLVDLFVVSPKLDHAGMPLSRTMRPDVLARWAELARAKRAVLKIVARTVTDVADVVRLANRLDVPGSRVWVMPEGEDAATVTERGRQLVGPVLAGGLNFSTRLHVLLWGTERGR